MAACRTQAPIRSCKGQGHLERYQCRQAAERRWTEARPPRRMRRCSHCGSHPVGKTVQAPEVSSPASEPMLIRPNRSRFLQRKDSRRKNGLTRHSEWSTFLARTCWTLLKSREFARLYALRRYLEDSGETYPLSRDVTLKEVVKFADIPVALQFLREFDESATRKLYTALMRRAKANSDDGFEVVREIFKQGWQAYENHGREEAKPDGIMCAEFIRSCAVHGKYTEGFAALQRSCPSIDDLQDIHICNAVLELTSSRDPTECMDWFDQLVSRSNGVFVPTLDSINIVMRSAVAAKAFDRCEDYYNYMRALGLGPNTDTFCQLVEAYGGRGDLPRAQVVVEQMQSVGQLPDAEIWLALLKAASRARNVTAARKIWMKMTRFLQVQGKGPPSVDLYNAMMEVYISAGDGHSALEVFEQMGKGDDNGDVVKASGGTFALAMQACTHLSSSGVVRKEDMERAWGLFTQMENHGVAQSKATFAIMLSIVCHIDEDRFMQVLSQSCRQFGHKSVSEFSRECVRFHLFRGSLTSAWKIYEKSWSLWTEKKDAVLFNDMLAAATAESDFSRAFSVMKHMRKLDHRPKDSQISILQSAMVDSRVSGADLGLQKDFAEEDGQFLSGGDAIDVRIYNGPARDMRFQVLSALNSVKLSGSLSPLRFHLDCALSSQIVCALLENDLNMSVNETARGSQVTLEVTPECLASLTKKKMSAAIAKPSSKRVT
mmetsp:Transcript_5213/g.13621  ORF Transcript_5213/g.13621 Transcript_5213/m.13621 type:complete len:716 (-) Transcript_5213:27-2174(-)